MSEPDTLAYMTDDFALPRWNTQQPHDSLSSSAQAAQSAAQASSYLFSPAPPQSGVSSNRLPAIQQSPTGASRQPRINQLLDEDQPYPMNSVPYSSGASLSRSASFGGVGGAARARRTICLMISRVVPSMQIPHLRSDNQQQISPSTFKIPCIRQV